MNHSHVPNCPLHLTVEDVAHHLRTDHTTITTWLEDGHLPGYRLPDRWLVTVDDLQTYLDHDRTGPANPNSTINRDRNRLFTIEGVVRE